MDEFIQVVVNLQSPDNETRARADEAFQNAKKTHLNQVAETLVHLMASSEAANVRQLCAVLLRRCVERSTEKVWAKFPETFRASTKECVVSRLANEPEQIVRDSVIHLMAEIAAQELPSNNWPELLQSVMAMSQSDNAVMRVTAFACFDKIAEYAAEAVRPHSTVIGQTLVKGLQDQSSPEVRVAALNAVSSLLLAIEDETEVAPFKEVVPFMINVLRNALEQNAEVSARDGLKALVGVVDSHPKFLRGHLDRVGETIATIVAANSLEDETRQVAMELVVTMSEQAPTMVRKNANLVGTFIPLAMELIAQGTDEDFNLQEWDAREEDPEALVDNEEEPLSEFGQEAVDRIARALGGKAVLPIANTHLPNYLQHQDWRRRRAALLTITMLAEGCGKTMFAQINEIVPGVVGFFKDSHPRVRMAALQVVSQLAIDFSSAEKCGKGKTTNFQSATASVVLPALVEILGEPENAATQAAPSWRVRGRAAAAVVCFCAPEFCKKKLVRPYADQMLSNLFNLVRNGPRQVKEESLTAISNVASVLEQEFGKYYDHFMPLAKEILETADPSTCVVLRGKAMECISLIGTAVGRDRFAADAKVVMDLLFRAGNSTDGQNETFRQYYMQACALICGCLEEDFLPYMEHVLPPLIQGAECDVGITLVNSEAERAELEAKGMELLNLNVRGVGERSVAINTSALQDKNNSCMAIFRYADALKGKFLPFVPAVAKAMVPLLEFQHHESIQVSAACTMPKLLDAVTLGIAENNGTDYTMATELLMAIVPGLIKAMSQPSASLEDLQVLGESLSACLTTAAESGGFKDGETDQLWADARLKRDTSPKFGVPVDKLEPVLTGIMQLVEDRVNERVARRKEIMADEDFDEDQLMVFNETEEEEDEVILCFIDSVGSLIKSHKSAIIPAFDKILHPAAQSVMKVAEIPSLASLALCLYDDVVEFASPQAQKYIPMVAEFYIASCSHPATAVQQSAVYGLGVFAQHGGDAFKPFAKASFDRLVEMINHPDSRNEDNDPVTDNAVSAVQKLCTFRADCGIAPEQVLPFWLQCLPSTADAMEARVSHLQLMQYIHAGNPHIIGANNENWAKIFVIFAEAILEGIDGETMEYDEDLACMSPETRKGVAALVRNLQCENAQAFEAALGALNEEQQQCLQVGMAIAERGPGCFSGCCDNASADDGCKSGCCG